MKILKKQLRKCLSEFCQWLEEKWNRKGVVEMKKFYIIPLMLCFFLVAPSCKKTQEEKKATVEEGVVEEDKKLPKLSNEEKKKLESLGYVE